MFSFNPGNPNLSFKSGSSPSNLAPFSKPTQGQIGKGIDPMMLMMAMQGMGEQNGNETNIINGTDKYDGSSNPMNAMPYQTQQSDYAKKIKMALGGL